MIDFRHFSSIELNVADTKNGEKIGIEFDLSDIYLTYKERRLLISDHELFDILQEFIERQP